MKKYSRLSSGGGVIGALRVDFVELLGAFRETDSATFLFASVFFAMGANSFLKSWPHFGRAVSSRETNRKSQ